MKMVQAMGMETMQETLAAHLHAEMQGLLTLTCKTLQGRTQPSHRPVDQS